MSLSLHCCCGLRDHSVVGGRCVAPEKYTAIYTVGGWMIALDKVNIINTLLAHK